MSIFVFLFVVSVHVRAVRVPREGARPPVQAGRRPVRPPASLPGPGAFRAVVHRRFLVKVLSRIGPGPRPRPCFAGPLEARKERPWGDYAVRQFPGSATATPGIPSRTDVRAKTMENRLGFSPFVRSGRVPRRPPIVWYGFGMRTEGFSRARPRSRTGADGVLRPRRRRRARRPPVSLAGREGVSGQYSRTSVSDFFFTSMKSPNSASKRSRSMPMAAIASFALTVMRFRIAPSL